MTTKMKNQFSYKGHTVEFTVTIPSTKKGPTGLHVKDSSGKTVWSSKKEYAASATASKAAMLAIDHHTAQKQSQPSVSGSGQNPGTNGDFDSEHPRDDKGKFTDK